MKLHRNTDNRQRCRLFYQIRAVLILKPLGYAGATMALTQVVFHVARPMYRSTDVPLCRRDAEKRHAVCKHNPAAIAGPPHLLTILNSEVFQCRLYCVPAQKSSFPPFKTVQPFRGHPYENWHFHAQYTHVHTPKNGVPFRPTYASATSASLSPSPATVGCVPRVNHMIIAKAHAQVINP